MTKNQKGSVRLTEDMHLLIKQVRQPNSTVIAQILNLPLSNNVAVSL